MSDGVQDPKKKKTGPAKEEQPAPETPPQKIELPLDPSAGRVETRIASLEQTIDSLKNTVEKLIAGRTQAPQVKGEQSADAPASGDGGFFTGRVNLNFFPEKIAKTGD